MRLHTRLSLLSAAVALACSAGAVNAASLSIALGGAVTTIDPHFYSAGPNNSVSMHIFDRLTQTTADLLVEPGLAESWKPISDTEWEFKLREGVKWHDGKPFTSDDVAFSIARVPNVPNSPAGFGGYVRTITKVETPDPLTVRLHTAAPAPNLPRDMAFVSIVSRHAGEGASTDDYNSGKAAIGTGPYKFAAYTPGDRLELVRNDDWWGPKPDWEKVSIRVITNPGARVAALLSGGVDVIDTPPATDLPRLNKDERISVFSTDGVRLIYIQPDFSRTGDTPGVTDNDGKPLDKNPFQDKRVRQALSLAINRDALADRVMQGTASPAGQWLPKGMYSYAPNLEAPRQDLDKVKQLLTEAGYPKGFQVTLATPNDRYPNDAATAQAVASMWSRAGIKTSVDAIPWSSYSVRRAKQDFGISLIGWGSGSGEAGQLLINVLGTYDTAKRTGAANGGRYSSPELDALRDKALSTLDDNEREKLLIQATEMAMDDGGLIPLHMLRNFWGTRKGLVLEPRKDERTAAMSIKPAP